jgi:hypothetical protein
MMIYIRKAGVDIRGMSDVLNFHRPSDERGHVVSLEGAKDLRKK